jgi:hypothetical protein
MQITMESPQKSIYRVYHQAGTDYVVMEWNGYANSRQFREGTEKMFEELSKYKVNKVLGDIKEMVLISQEDQEWLIGSFLPRAIAGGMEAVALLRPNHYFNKVAVETVAYKVNQEKLSIQFFNNAQEALAWLREFRKS